MQWYDQNCGIKSRPCIFVPGAGTLTVHSEGLDGRSVPISLAACSYKP